MYAFLVKNLTLSLLQSTYYIVLIVCGKKMIRECMTNKLEKIIQKFNFNFKNL